MRFASGYNSGFECRVTAGMTSRWGRLKYGEPAPDLARLGQWGARCRGSKGKMKAAVQQHEPLNRSNRNRRGFANTHKTEFWMSLGVALIATVSSGAQHHVEYGLNISLGPNYYEHYEQGPAPVGLYSPMSRIRLMRCISAVERQ